MISREEKMESLPLPNPSGIWEERSNAHDFPCPLKWNSGSRRHDDIHTNRYGEVQEILVGFMISVPFRKPGRP